MYTFRKRSVIRSWLMWLWKLAGPGICRVCQQAWRLRKAETLVLVCVPEPETQEEPVFPSKSKGGRKVDIPIWRLSGSQHSYLWVVSLFVPVRSSADWTRPIHIMEDSLLSSVYQHVNLIQKQPPHRPTQNNVGPNIWALDGSVKLT